MLGEICVDSDSWQMESANENTKAKKCDSTASPNTHTHPHKNAKYVGVFDGIM